VEGACGSPAPKMRTSADSSQPERASLENCCSASAAHVTAHTEAQRLWLIACLATSNFKLKFGIPWRVPPAALLRKYERLQIDRSQKELARKRCCSASSAHGTAHTEAQRLGLLACPALSNFKRIFRGPCRAHSAVLLRKCERLQIARSQKELAKKAVPQPHLPMALLVQRHREWGCLLVLPPQTSNVAWEIWCPCQATFAALLRKCERLQIAGSQKLLAWKAVAQPHLPMALLAQRHRDWGCLLFLPPQTSNVSLGVRAGGLQQPCSEHANVCR